MMQVQLCNGEKTIFEMTSEEVYEILKNVPVVEPEPDEILAIKRARESILREGTVPFESIQWE